MKKLQFENVLCTSCTQYSINHEYNNNNNNNNNNNTFDGSLDLSLLPTTSLFRELHLSTLACLTYNTVATGVSLVTSTL